MSGSSVTWKFQVLFSHNSTFMTESEKSPAWTFRVGTQISSLAMGILAWGDSVAMNLCLDIMVSE